ncbi:MAG: DUF4271 domain-containing protein [Cyclobacteriaceae bacterium]|nr:DUF4271 domain-containing protein [Cyclobacteriaceae bacterium]
MISPKRTTNLLISIVAILVTNTLCAQSDNFLVKKDMRLDWMFYDARDKVMLPFLDHSPQYPVAIHLALANEYGHEAMLLLEIPGGTSLFLQNKFIWHYAEDTTARLLIDSLTHLFGNKTLQLTLYNGEAFASPANAKIGFEQSNFKSATTVNPISKRILDHRGDYFKIIILLLFTFFVILRTLFPSDLFDFLDFRTLFTFRYTDTLISKYRSITKTQILVVVFQAALLSALLIVFFYYYHNPFDQYPFMSTNPLLSWVTFVGLILVLFILKYVLISIFSFLFGMEDRINFYFIEFMRMSMIFYTLLFVVLSYVIINKFYLLEDLIDGLVLYIVAFNILRYIMLYFKFRAIVSMKNLHLFSYLCSTELIPIILGIRFFIK